MCVHMCICKCVCVCVCSYVYMTVGVCVRLFGYVCVHTNPQGNDLATAPLKIVLTVQQTGASTETRTQYLPAHNDLATAPLKIVLTVQQTGARS